MAIEKSMGARSVQIELIDAGCWGRQLEARVAHVIGTHVVVWSSSIRGVACHRSNSRTWIFTFTAAAYNIVRLRRLLPATA